jgi:copper chaperone CopZ
MASIDLGTGSTSCVASASAIERAVADLPGVSGVSADCARGRTHLEFDPSVISVEKIVAAVTDAGYVLGRDWFAA